MDESTNIWISLDLLLVVWNSLSLGVVTLNPLSPLVISSLDSVRDFLEELEIVVVKTMLREGFEVKPLFVIHPGEDLVSVIDTSSCLKEHADIRLRKFVFLNKDLGADHDLEGDLRLVGADLVAISRRCGAQA